MTRLPLGHSRAGAALLGVLLACGLLQGSSASAQEKRITWGKPAEITSFDVQIAGTVTSWEMYELVYETLLTTDADLRLQPGLAESWEQAAPTTYVLKLRANAKWSNGRAVTSADVIGTFKRLNDPKIASYWARQLGSIKSMEAPDERTVKVELAEPHTAFLPALAHITAAIIPAQEFEAGSFDPTKQMLGSGPYMVVDHKQDESWTLARNPYYWRKGYPLADEIDVKIMPDESARIAALRDGRIDYTTFGNPDIGRLVAGDKDIKVLAQQTTNYFRIDVNAKRAQSPFHDKRVRQAMNLALDREAINALVFAGSAAVDYPVPAAFGKQACHDVPTYAVPRAKRLEMAKALLKEAAPPSLKVDLIASPSDPLFPRIAQVVQQNLADIGMEVQILQLPLAEYLSKVFTKGEFDFAISWLAGYSDPTMIVSWWNPKYAVWNQVFQEDVPALDAALEEVKKLPDGPARDQKLIEICRMIDDGANLLALDSKIDYVGYRADRIAVRIDPRSGSSNIFQHIAEFKPLK
jgi:peptide/nickel transport system substrate-binding protein